MKAFEKCILVEDGKPVFTKHAAWKIPVVFVFSALVWFNFKEIFFQYNLFRANIFCGEFKQFLIVCFFLIAEYVIISLMILFSVSLFKNLKDYKEDGLLHAFLYGLLIGFLGGLFCGIFTGVMFGLMFGLISRVIFGLLGGLFGGLIAGLIFGLILALFVGFTDEFK